MVILNPVINQGFRSQYSANPTADQEAARFFSNNQVAATPPLVGPSAYDLSALHTTLPAYARAQPSVQTPPVSSPVPAVAEWASDFLQHQPVQKPFIPQEYGPQQSPSSLTPVASTVPSQGMYMGHRKVSWHTVVDTYSSDQV